MNDKIYLKYRFSSNLIQNFAEELHHFCIKWLLFKHKNFIRIFNIVIIY